MRKILALSLLLIFAAAVSAQSESISAGSANDNYLILSTKRISTMEKELAEAGSKGFRVLYGSPTQSADMALFLQKGDSPVDYKILATARISTMEKELNAGRPRRLSPASAYHCFQIGLRDRGAGYGDAA